MRNLYNQDKLLSSVRRHTHHLGLLACVVAIPVTSLHAQEVKKRDGQKSITEQQMMEAAHQIDVKVAKIYRKKGISAPKAADDSVFLRRSFLLAAGRIPTIEEAKDFLESEDPNKRQLLVSYLMSSKGYESQMGNWLIDMLRVKDKFSNRRTAAPYMDWVRESVRENKPFNQLTRELLSAQGSMWENGAVGYYIRDKGMPLDNMANTMRLFLGTRMECAQCHDHPFDDWERMDFYRLAAFSNGQKPVNGKVWSTLWKKMRKEDTERSALGKVIRYLGDEVYYNSLTGAGTGRIKLPEDYQYSDGEPGELVAAKTPFGKSVRMSDRRNHDDGLQRFAEWVIAPENIQFATIITNRMWKRILGVGLFEPIDEYIKAEDTTSPELTHYLVKLMQDMNYDLKAFQQVLMLTRVYAFESSSKTISPGEKPLFDGRQIERMSAEHYWDSLVTLIAGNPDKLPARKASDAIHYRNKPILVGEMTMLELQKEVLELKTPEELSEYGTKLVEKMNKEKSSRKRSRGRKSLRGGMTGIARASELQSPAPAGHVLEIFGQSDRELLESSTREANASQVLAMMNGQVEELVVANKNAHIYQVSQGSTEDRIRSIFMGTLSRLPSDSELSLMKAEVKERGEQGYHNIVSALVNTREFLFIP